MTEAFERLERARGALYTFHQLVGGADAQLDSVIEWLHSAGRADLARELRETLVGRDVLPGRWTFEVVDEFDDDFFSAWREWTQRLRDELTAGRRHAAEAQLKNRRQQRST